MSVETGNLFYHLDHFTDKLCVWIALTFVAGNSTLPPKGVKGENAADFLPSIALIAVHSIDCHPILFDNLASAGSPPLLQPCQSWGSSSKSGRTVLDSKGVY